MNITDQELESLRDQLYAMAQIILPQLQTPTKNKPQNSCTYEWEERAAIHEFDGGMARAEAPSIRRG